MPAKYNFLALPAMDKDQRMVGSITFDDAMDVMVEETTEDMELMASPFITTILDALSLLVYFGIARVLLFG